MNSLKLFTGIAVLGLFAAGSANALNVDVNVGRPGYVVRPAPVYVAPAYPSYYDPYHNRSNFNYWNARAEHRDDVQDYRRDKRELREDVREYRQDMRQGNTGDLRSDRREIRQDKRDLRGDVRDLNRYGY